MCSRRRSCSPTWLPLIVPDGELGQALPGRCGRSGFEVLGFWDNGFRHMTNRLRPIRAPRRLSRGMTVRLQPNAIHEELIRSWGAIPVAAELSAGIQLISRLEVDAQENPLANTVAYGVDRVHRHVTMTGHLYGARGLFSHRPTWEDFEPDLRAVVSNAARSAIDVQRRAAGALESTLRARLEDDEVEFVDLTHWSGLSSWRPQRRPSPSPIEIFRRTSSNWLGYDP